MNKITKMIFCTVAVVIVIALAFVLIFGNDSHTHDDGMATTGSNSPSTNMEGTVGTGNEVTFDNTPATDHVGGLDISFGVETIPSGDREQSGTIVTNSTSPTEQTPEDTTGATENTQATTDDKSEVRKLTYEEFAALSSQEQFAYAERLGVEAYIKWKLAAIADYNERHPEETIGGGVIDLSGTTATEP